MNKVNLSICIATRNRGTLIGETLESIICQATEQVEIVILDGASTDNTAEVVRRYQKRFPQVRYYRQNANLGVDQDFTKAVELAQGEYCWLFADDDILRAGAIQTVLEGIHHAYGLLIVNAEIRNADLTEVLKPRRLRISASRVYNPTENQRLFRDVADYLSFIGCVVIKRQLWDAREKEKYFGSGFVHVGVIFQDPLPEDTLVIAEPLISIRYGNASWHADTFGIWFFKWPNLIWSFSNYPDSVKRELCHKEPWRTMRNLLLRRAQGTFTMKEYTEWLEPRLDSRWTRAVTKMIAQFPGRVANFLGIVYYRTFRRRPDRMLVFDLEKSPFYFWTGRNQRPRAGNGDRA